MFDLYVMPGHCKVQILCSNGCFCSQIQTLSFSQGRKGQHVDRTYTCCLFLEKGKHKLVTEVRKTGKNVVFLDTVRW